MNRADRARTAALPAGAPKLTYADPEDPWLKVQLIRAIEVATGRLKLERIYRALKRQPDRVDEFFSEALRLGRIDIDQDGLEAHRIPTDGPLVFIANHPFGLVDGLMLCDLAMRCRGQFQILLNARLCKDDDLEPFFLPVDFNETRSALTTTIATKRAALETLKANGTILIFPGGGIATAPLRGGRAEELPWTTFAAKLISQARATVVPVYFHGQNSRLFHVASAMGETVRTAVLLFEARNKLGKRFRMTVGAPLPYESLSDYGGRAELTEFLYRQTLALEHTPPQAS
ncbi:MAG: lysophospholipid acyltransferase family protein [Pseudomonadota bacterium]